MRNIRQDLQTQINFTLHFLNYLIENWRKTFAVESISFVSLFAHTGVGASDVDAVGIWRTEVVLFESALVFVDAICSFDAEVLVSSVAHTLVAVLFVSAFGVQAAVIVFGILAFVLVCEQQSFEVTQKTAFEKHKLVLNLPEQKNPVPS